MTITPIEVSVVAGAFILFSFLPGVFGWMASVRQRRAHAMALRLAAPEPAPVVPLETEPFESVANPVVAELPTVVAQPSTEEAVPSLPVAEPPVPQPAAALVVVDAGGHSFRLDDLRRARILETPPHEVLDNPAGQQQWEDGLRLSEKHAGLIGGTALSVSFEPQSRCFGGMRDLGETKELRFFLFSELWPTSIEQAAAEAVFELGDAGMVKAYVARR